MNTKTEKDKNQGQNTSQSSQGNNMQKGSNQQQGSNKQQGSNQQKGSNEQGKKTGFKEGMDNQGWSDDVENSADQKQAPEIDKPAQQPERTEKKIPNMNKGL